MKHICSICGRVKYCPDDPCDEPETLPMNCGVMYGTPYHQEEYKKVMKNG